MMQIRQFYPTNNSTHHIWQQRDRTNNKKTVSDAIILISFEVKFQTDNLKKKTLSITYHSHTYRWGL